MGFETTLDTRLGNSWGLGEIAVYFVELFIYKIQKNLTDTENWISALLTAAHELHIIDMDKAKEIYNEKFIKASPQTSYKRLFTEGEIRKLLSKKSVAGKSKTFLEATAALLKNLQQVKKNLENLKKAIKICKDIRNWNRRLKFDQTNTSTPEEALKQQMKISSERFLILMEVLKEVNSFSPPGFREYADYCLRICAGSKRIFDKTEAYAEKLTVQADEAQKGFAKALKNKTSKLSSTLFLKKDNGRELNRFLDSW